MIDDTFQVRESFGPMITHNGFNMHEFNVIDEGKSVLSIISRSQYVDITSLNLERRVGWVIDIGFQEFDVATAKAKFQWWSTQHLSLTESSVPVTNLNQPHPSGWNWL